MQTGIAMLLKKRLSFSRYLLKCKIPCKPTDPELPLTGEMIAQ